MEIKKQKEYQSDNYLKTNGFYLFYLQQVIDIYIFFALVHGEKCNTPASTVQGSF
jgi:hypothetical protein